MNGELGLRERKKQQTRQLIRDAALRLFAEHGFDRVAVVEVARTADVSEATVFNYFPTKEDLVYDRMDAFEEELLQAMRDRPAGQSVLAAFMEFVLAPRGLLAAEAADAVDTLVTTSRIVAGSPALLARERQILAGCTDALAMLIAEDVHADADDPLPWITAHALIGVHQALISHVRRRVLAGRPNLPRLAREVRAHAAKALALLDRGLGTYAVRPPATP
jgi:AcrR family transcriptional regulator